MGRIEWLRSSGTPGGRDALMRAAVGYVFVVSGLLKFLFENQGAGRFAKLGLPAPGLLAPLVGSIEIGCGLLVALGLFTRAAAIALAVDMLVAIVVTKLPLLAGAGPEPVGAPPKTGLLAFLYQARLDVTMLAASVYFARVGAGASSFDARRAERRAHA